MRTKNFRRSTLSENKLIIFDFDGVIVDTEYTTFLYYKQILPKYGIKLKEEDFQYKVGRKSIDFFKTILKDKFEHQLVEHLIAEKRKAFQLDIRKYLKPIRGAFDLIHELNQEGLILAIGSQNERELLNAAVNQFGIRHYFKIIRSLQDIKNKKPHPEIFLGIANSLSIDPSHSVVIEDSVDGVLAARAGGFKVVAVTTAHEPESLKNAHLIVSGPSELSAKILRLI